MRPDQVSVVPSSVIASVGSFEDAQRTADYLRSFGMDAGSLSIVGADLRQARKRQAVPVVKLTAAGALRGAVLGLLAGVFVTLVAETSLTGLAVVVWGFVYGGLLGTLHGLFRGLIRNRPDAVETEVVPTRYELRCPADELSVAHTLLTTAGATDYTADADQAPVEQEVVAEPEERTEHKRAA
ncbi:general stress protein [Kribbella sp. CA-247076]|uniref:general stress protein n=1 Tax=Kribbella sp. CA-247076 TaxID=3239941 RepID=UPI003D8DB184